MSGGGVERLELGPVVDDDDFGGDAFGGGGDAAAEGGENDLLRGAGGHAVPGEEGAGFSAADPMGDGGLFEGDFGAEGSHLCGDVIDGFLGLRGSAEAWADVVGEMAKLVEGVRVGDGGVAEFGHGCDLGGCPGAGAGAHEAAHDGLLHGGAIGRSRGGWGLRVQEGGSGRGGEDEEDGGATGFRAEGVQMGRKHAEW